MVTKTCRICRNAPATEDLGIDAVGCGGEVIQAQFLVCEDCKAWMFTAAAEAMRK